MKGVWSSHKITYTTRIVIWGNFGWYPPGNRIPRDHLGLTDLPDKFLGLWFASRRHPILPWFPEPKATIPAVIRAHTTRMIELDTWIWCDLGWQLQDDSNPIDWSHLSISFKQCLELTPCAPIVLDPPFKITFAIQASHTTMLELTDLLGWKNHIYEWGPWTYFIQSKKLSLTIHFDFCCIPIENLTF